jgi:hypothetical protein
LARLLRDVHVGTIAERVGNPHDTDPWEWSCGFYPGSHPKEHQSDTAATFEQARADFECASLMFLSNRTEADFQKWRDQRDWTERKYTLASAWSRQAMDPASPPIDFGCVPAARCSTCTRRTRC